jgi:hypothetical protein
MSKFDTMLEKIFGSLLSEDNTGLPPSSGDLRNDNTAYDYTVTVVKELIRTSLLPNTTDIRELIVGDDVNKGFYFTWDYKDLAYVVRILPSEVAGFEITITNLKDRTDVKRIDLHEEDAVDEVTDYLNTKRREKEENEGKPTQVSNEPSALPGGTASLGTGAVPSIPPISTTPPSSTADYLPTK